MPPQWDNPDQPTNLDVGLAAAFGPAVSIDDREGPSVRDEERADTRYQLLNEIAAGGMGVIIRCRDNDLGRFVAMKVLHPRHAGNAAMVRRFLEEAQIAGQLQHPGILQVYELGLRPDRRPYFTMKLIKGRTLAQLLADRQSPDIDRRRFIGIFERICQTMAYAHSRGVIHRDLKPANIMAGNFGEVQIVDWGLAKVIGRSESKAPDDARASVESAATVVPAETEISVPDSDRLGPQSVAGSIMGTPAYMPPEQARGDVDQIDERCDVFALGAILCEVLTGKPPYTGNAADTLDDAKVGHLDDAWARIEACGADEELIAVAKNCLGRRRRDRPADAREVAGTVTQYIASVDERARKSELDAVEARARAAVERRARRLTVALAAAILLAVVLGGGGLVLSQNQRLKRIADASQEANDRLNEAMALLTQAKETSVSQQGPWMALRFVGAQVAALQGADELDAETRVRANAFLDEFKLVDRDRQMIERIEDLVIVGATHEDKQSWLKMEADLRQAFLDYGIDVLQSPRDEIAAQIRASALAPQLADGLELWIGTLGYLSELDASAYTKDEILAWVTTLYDADPDPYRTSVRKQVYADSPDAAVLQTLALSAEFERAMPRTLAWLGMAQMRVGAVDGMDDVYRRALLLYPTDFMLNFDYAYMLEHVERWEEAMRYYHRALTLRPKNAGIWRRLGVALRITGDLDGAIHAIEQSIRYQSDYAPTWVDMGLTRIAGGELKEAIAAYRQAIDVEPRHALAHCHLGRALQSGNFLSEAMIELQRGHELGSVSPNWDTPSQQWIDECRQLLADRKTLPATPWRSPG
ncbi:MAG: serine/threonine-protein kinase [Phycisphaerales bacterium]